MSIQVIFGLNKCLVPLLGISLQSCGNGVINLYISFGLNKFLAPFRGNQMNLKINILIKERNANLDIFLCFTKISENERKQF